MTPELGRPTDHHPTPLAPLANDSAHATASPQPLTSTTTASRVIAAPSDAIYRVLADYRTHHPRILPKPYFVSLHVVQGGIGEGTVAEVTMRVMGRWQDLRLEVTEPEPGRVIAERDLLGGAITTLTVDPLGPSESRVTIQTTWPRERGLRAWLEAKTTERVARHIYAQELASLAEHVRGDA